MRLLSATALVVLALGVHPQLSNAQACEFEPILSGDYPFEIGRIDWPDELSLYQVLVFGEVHGTWEIPGLVAGFLRSREPSAPLVLALELPAGLAPDVQALLSASSGDLQNALQQFLRQPFWTDGADGRNSVAVLRLLLTVHELRQDGRVIDVLLLDGDHADRDGGMASRLFDSIQVNPLAQHVVLVGNVHARLTTPPDAGPFGQPFASRLVDAGVGVLSLNVGDTRGSAWMCTSSGCGSHQMAPPSAKALPPTVSILEGWAEADYSGTFSVGNLSASPPAADALCRL